MTARGCSSPQVSVDLRAGLVLQGKFDALDWRAPPGGTGSSGRDFVESRQLNRAIGREKLCRAESPRRPILAGRTGRLPETTNPRHCPKFAREDTLEFRTGDNCRVFRA